MNQSEKKAKTPKSTCKMYMYQSELSSERKTILSWSDTLLICHFATDDQAVNPNLDGLEKITQSPSLFFVCFEA